MNSKDLLFTDGKLSKEFHRCAQPVSPNLLGSGSITILLVLKKIKLVFHKNVVFISRGLVRTVDKGA